MGSVHQLVSSRSVVRGTQSIIAVVCAYSCRPGEEGEAGRNWQQALELARAGFDVWVVTPSAHRCAIEHTLATPPLEPIHVLFWDAPPLWSFLQRCGGGARLHGWIWRRWVGRAIDDWQRAVGMHVLRRVTDVSRTSVTWLVLPAVHRARPPQFAWRPQQE